jgi:prefoldin subunit 5
MAGTAGIVKGVAAGVAGDKLKLDIDGLDAEIRQIDSAIRSYKRLGETPLATEIGYVEMMNADYTAKLKTMLEDLNENNSKLVTTLDEISTAAKKIRDNLKSVDTNAASGVTSGK